MAEFFFHRILVDPLVTMIWSGREELWPGVVYTNLIADGRPAHVLISLSWALDRHLAHIIDVVGRARSQYPNLHFTLLAATAKDESLARTRGIETLLCNHNCFLDERLIYPDLKAQKLYGAVHNARLAPFKRPELARHVQRLAIVTAGYQVDKDYAAKTITAMDDLAYCNLAHTSGVLRSLTIEQVRRILSQSWCGLALSAAEGAMFASAEYLLAGIPVVTTRSTGGRDVFFHPDYVATVDDDPVAVAGAALDFQTRKLDPISIRNRTIALFRPHRQRLVARLSELAGSDLSALADDAMWLPQFRHQMRHRLKFDLGSAADGP